MVSANEDMGMPFAIVIDLEDFAVRTQSRHVYWKDSRSD